MNEEFGLYYTYSLFYATLLLEKLFAWIWCQS